MTPPPLPRVHVLMARAAPLGVIIRRGPHRRCHLLTWDTRTDAVTPGQWLKSARVYPLRCDLTPDGTKLVYFALDGRFGGDSPTRGTYTAVSRPPYFTAMVLWPKGDAWHGGGLFVDDRTLWLNGPHERPLGPPPQRLRVTPTSPYPPTGNAECLGVYFPRLIRDGWEPGDHEERGEARVFPWTKTRRGLRLRRRTFSTTDDHVRSGRGVYFDEHEVVDDATGVALPLRNAEWADFDQQDRLVYAADGRLWTGAVAAGRLVEREVVDLRPMVFRAMPPPPEA